jgi:pSer/pThr/pTyr-binding forkhead associated (FHA) protein
LKILAAPEGQPVGHKLALAEGENVAGRVAPPSSVVLNGTKVSKRHCTFTVAAGALSVEDNQSSNGVFVNGKKTPRSPLRARDRLVIGEFILEVGEEG